jgi:hypothetical protein
LSALDAAAHGVSVVGALAVEAIEAWILAFRLDAFPERRRDPKAILAGPPHSVRTLEAMLEAINNGEFAAAENASPSLRDWLHKARAKFGAIAD